MNWNFSLRNFFSILSLSFDQTRKVFSRREFCFQFKKFVSSKINFCENWAFSLGRDRDVNGVTGAVNKAIKLLHLCLVSSHQTPENCRFRAVFQAPKWTSAFARRPRHFCEAFVQGQVVPDGVLPVPRSIEFVVGMLLSDRVVNFRQSQHAILSGHQGLCNHLSVGQLRLRVNVR